MTRLPVSITRNIRRNRQPSPRNRGERPGGLAARVAFSVLLSVGLGLLLSLASPSRANADPLPGNPDQAEQAALAQRAAHTLILSFDPDASQAERDRVIAQTGGDVVRWIPALDSVVLDLNPSAQGELATATADPAQILAVAQTDSSVRRASFDGVATAAYLPNDPALNNPGLVYAPQIINAPAAWDLTLGHADVVIAVLDTGILATHEEFGGRVLPGYDFQNNDADPTDDKGHGTHVAGIAGASADNGVGMAGICPNCALLPVKVLDRTGSGTWSTVAAGIIYATDQGADIINLSLGGYSPSFILEEAVTYAQDRNVLVVAAVGNHASTDTFYPAAYDRVLGVAATTAQDTLWAMNNHGSFVDVAAPGETIYSAAIIDSPDGEPITDAYTFMSGSSMATPHVAGLAGLLLDLDPTLTALDLHDLICAGTLAVSGTSSTLEAGNGRIDAQAAIAIMSDTPSAIIAGQIWHDTNQNGLREADETDSIADLTVTLMDLATGDLHQTVSDAQGAWAFTGLKSGTYQAEVADVDDLFITTAYHIQINMGHDEVSDRNNFGFSHALPPTAISDFGVTLDEQQVTIHWRVNHPDVQTVAVQRADADTGTFETIAVLDASQAIATDGIHLVDILPQALVETDVVYRLLVQPSALVVGPATATDAATSRIFLPQLVTP